MKIIRVGHNEPLFSIAWRFIRAIYWRSSRRFPGANHFCAGESGSGEWSCRSTVGSSICGYCKQPNAPAHREPGDTVGAGVEGPDV